MGLDLTYSLAKKIDFNKKFKDYEDISISNNFIDIYYRLNWSGVSLENKIFITAYLFKNFKHSFETLNYDFNYKYLIINDNGYAFIGDANEVKESFKYISLERVNRLILENKIIIRNPLSYLHFNLWSGCNGDTFF